MKNLMNIKNQLITFLFLIIISMGTQINTAYAQEIEIDYVAYRGGKFVQTNTKEWKEFNRGNNGKKFFETHRDEWSVYLKTATSTRKSWQKVQLDLHTKEVKYSDNNQTKSRVLYKITPTIDVDYIAYDGGKFIRTGVEEWKEYNKDNNGRVFKETARDEWSVYLQANDLGNNGWARIQLDLHTKEVKYSDYKNKTSRVIYKIIPSVAVSKVEYKGGRFAQTGTNEWKEYNKDNNGKVFIETHRDQWSVYLNARDVAKNSWQRVQLDLHTKQVNYSDNNNTQPRLLYSITESNIK